MESQFLISAPLKKKMDLNTSTINKTNKANKTHETNEANKANKKNCVVQALVSFTIA